MSWEQLRTIVRQDAAERAFWDAQPPRACPHDGTPLLSAPPGTASVELYCPHDGYQWPESGSR